MKLKIRESSEALQYVNTEDSGFNYYRLKIIQVFKYILLYSDD